MARRTKAMERIRQIRLPVTMDDFLVERAERLGSSVSLQIREAVAAHFSLPSNSTNRTVDTTETRVVCEVPA